MRFVTLSSCWGLLASSLLVFGADNPAIVQEKPVVEPVNVPGGKTDPTAFFGLPGFKVERLYHVPKDKFGSWVAFTFDNKGRIIVSDQDKKGLYRITPPKIGTDEQTKVEPLSVKMTSAQGLLWAFDSLYVSVNGGPGSGLYRLRDTNGDDQFDEVKKLKAIRGGGEHGPHALRLSPDGKSILMVCGNHTQPPEDFASSRLPKNWGEDHLLPRQWDAGGHARGVMAPGGYIAKTDPEGKNWEILNSGYRNTYDIGLNGDGEIFAYDSDMEWDMGSPWYRPTRVIHAVSGGEFGWRSGTGKWPTYYPDSLPGAIDIGPGSPVGVEFGYNTRFPAKYQKALYILDWTFGTIYALHFEPNGATYKTTKEEFLSKTPLPLTDIAVGPDGALYFTTGGRNTQSDLYRVTYVGSEPTDKVEYKNTNLPLHNIRRHLEAYHAPAQDPAKAIEFAYPYLSHEDRYLRYAARVALENQPVKLWQDRVLKETNADALIQGAIALARQGDKSVEPALLAALDRLDFGKLPERLQLDLLRAYGLVFIRLGAPDAPTASKLATKLDPFFPAVSDALSRELCQVLVYLKSPNILPRTIAELQKPSKVTPNPGLDELLARNKGYGGSIAAMIKNGADQQKLSYIFLLRNVKDGWNMDQRKVYFGAINEARQRSGGSSFQGFLNNIERDLFDNVTDADRLAIEAAGLRKPFKPKELPKAAGPGKDWKMEDLLALEPKLKGRNFKNGQKAFGAARCVVCHRFYGDGGATGPDLTQSAGRFSFKDMAESIIEPNKVVSDQYKAFTVSTVSSKVYSGKIVGDTKAGISILTDPEDSTKVVDIKRDDIDEIKPSTVSLMPQDLLKPLNENEVLDLMAYLLSRGDPNHAYFKK
jgi:putative heme-binding domain-containing protein